MVKALQNFIRHDLDCKKLSFFRFSHVQISHQRISLLSYCRVTRATALLPPSPITSSCHVLARSTMFFCAILYRRQIWIVERSCCARNRQLQRWAPKGLHRIHVEHQQLPSLSSLKGIRQNRSRLRFEILLPLFVANVHIRMHTYYEIVYIGNRTCSILLVSLYWRNSWRLAYGTSWDEREMCEQSKKAQRYLPQTCSICTVYTTEKEKNCRTRDEKSNVTKRIERCQVDLRSNTTLHWWYHSRGCRRYFYVRAANSRFEVEIDFKLLDFSTWIHLVYLKRIVRAFK